MPNQEWEYGTVTITRNEGRPFMVRGATGSIPAAYSQESLDSYLDKVGKEGWELVCTVGDVGRHDMYPALFFKRRKSE